MLVEQLVKINEKTIDSESAENLPGVHYGWVCCKCRSWSGNFDDFRQGCLACGNGKPKDAEPLSEALERVYGIEEQRNRPAVPNNNAENYLRSKD